MKKCISLYLLIVFVTTVITGCAQNKNNPEKVNPNESSLTLLLMNDEFWISYYEVTGTSLSLIPPNELFQVLNDAKEEKGKELNVIIRTSDPVHKATIDFIVEMIKSKGISKYFITKMTDKERERIMTGLANFRKPSELVLTMPKDEPEEHAVQTGKNWVTVILLAGDDSWCYQDTNMSRGALFNKKEFQHFISEKKKELGDSIRVVIKPIAQTSYKATVDALDQMTINQIKRYAMVKPLEEEERLLIAKGLIKPPVSPKNN